MWTKSHLNWPFSKTESLNEPGVAEHSQNEDIPGGGDEFKPSQTAYMEIGNILTNK